MLSQPPSLSYPDPPPTTTNNEDPKPENPEATKHIILPPPLRDPRPDLMPKYAQHHLPDLIPRPSYGPGPNRLHQISFPTRLDTYRMPHSFPGPVMPQSPTVCHKPPRSYSQDPNICPSTQTIRPSPLAQISFPASPGACHNQSQPQSLASAPVPCLSTQTPASAPV